MINKKTSLLFYFKINPYLSYQVVYISQIFHFLRLTKSLKDNQLCYEADCSVLPYLEHFPRDLITEVPQAYLILHYWFGK